MMVIAPNGTFVGQPGFARGNVLRGSSGFSDPTMVNLIPGNGRLINDIRSTDLMCKDSQTSQTQTSGSPRLQAPAGANVALRYQENGHVTLPQNQPGKPDNRGTVFVYGTTQPSATDEFLSIHRVWNAEGTGGDGRGVLLSTQNFDDGQCYQDNDGTISQQRQKAFPHTPDALMGANLWCQQDIQIPTTAPSGKPYTLYWVWDWPTLPGTGDFTNGKQEIYTTCMDVDIVAGTGIEKRATANSFIAGQDLNKAAIAAEFSDIANPTAVVGKSIAFSAATGVASATDTSGMSSTIASTTSVPSSIQDTSSQSSGFSTYLTETATGSAATATLPATAAATASNAGTKSGTRPAVSPVGASSTAIATSAVAGTNTSSRPTVSPIGATGSATRGAQSTNTICDQGFGCHTRANNNGNTQAAAASSSVPVAAPADADNTGTAVTTARQPQHTTTSVITAAPSTVTQFQTNVHTVTQTRMETVFASGASKRDESTPITESSSFQSTSTPEAAEAACSKSQPAYRLRARSPFYVLPPDEQLGNRC